MADWARAFRRPPDAMIKTVIFDLGNVIIPFDNGRAYRALAQHGPYSATEIAARLNATDLVNRFETGLIEPSDFAREVGRILGLKIGYDQFREIWSSVFLPETLLPESLLEDVAVRYRMLLLSNTNAIHFEMVRREYPLLRHFHDFVLSYQVKAMKPAPAIFHAAIERAQCAPHECFYADDIVAYVDAARRAGLDAVRFESRAQVERELAARGVRVDKTIHLTS